MSIDKKSLDEAILEFKERAEDSRKMSELGLKSYIPKAKEEEQLAWWLEELKKRRSEDYGYMADIHQSIGYRQALDDFVETLVSAFDETDIKEYGFYPENLVRQVAKQLKAGVKNETN